MPARFSRLMSPEWRHAFCNRAVSLGGLTLLLSTWRLWFPSGSFPQVPFVSGTSAVPLAVDWALSAIAIAALGVLFLDAARHRGTPYRAVVGGCLVLLILLNQHRFQPWVWFLILALVALSAPPASSLRLMRLIFFGVYFFSGLSKLDPTFLSDGGAWLLDGFLGVFGASTSQLTPTGRRLLLWSMPLGELATAVCVAVPRWRKRSVLLAMVMHLMLLLGLGPLGLGHKPGVLVWNAVCLVLAIPVLWPVPPAPGWWSGRPTWIPASCLSLLVLVLPWFGQQPVAVVDQWPSWVLYAAWPERVSVFVSEGDCKKLPPNVARQVVSVPVPGEWRQVRLDRWALQQVEAPEYPQNRFRLAVALSVLEAAKIDRCQIVVESAADATGRRSRTLLRGRRELADFLGRFWCHAKSRRSAVRQAGPPDG